MDIDLRSPEGLFLRALLKKNPYPAKLKEPRKGFRFTIRIPKFSKEYFHQLEDGRYSDLVIDEKTADVIEKFFESRFRDHFISFVSGVVHGSGAKRNSLKNAILYFMEAYNVHEVYTYDQLVKVYERSKTPLKKSIYDKTKEAYAIKSD
ncbi:MAG: hypothetical protein LAT81_08865 [Oceanicaulis sp.]|nr:hypothetical protein [Oceanicaulis sp.]